MDLVEACQVADSASRIIRPYCLRTAIVGSVRRRKLEGIHDIEILAEPLVTEQTPPDKLAPEPVNSLHEAMKRFVQEGTFSYGDSSSDGRKAPFAERYYRLKFAGQAFDLFVCLPPAQWGLLKLIRTGPADFSHEFVTRLWDFGLVSKDGHIETRKDGKILDTPEEQDAFRLCKVPYCEPQERTIDILRRAVVG